MENKLPEELNLEYKFLDEEWKKEYVLARIADAERTHFELMVDRLDPAHSEYSTWYEACQEIIEEIARLKFIFNQLGGSLGGEFVNMVPSDG